jgi:hypothetical protein
MVRELMFREEIKLKRRELIRDTAKRLYASPEGIRKVDDVILALD